MSKPATKYMGGIHLRVNARPDLDGLARHWSRGRMTVEQWEHEGDEAWLFFTWIGKGGHPSDMRRRACGDGGPTEIRAAVARFGVTEYLGSEGEHVALPQPLATVDWPALVAAHAGE